MEPDAIVIERIYNAPLERVWLAITDSEQMKKWYFDLEEFRAEAGFEFQFYGGTEEKQYLHLCRVTEVIPGKKLSYSWQYQGETGISFVTWELFAEGNKTRLRLTHSGLESFSAENPDLARKNFVAGWTEILGTNLVTFLHQ